MKYNFVVLQLNYNTVGITINTFLLLDLIINYISYAGAFDKVTAISVGAAFSPIILLGEISIVYNYY